MHPPAPTRSERADVVEGTRAKILAGRSVFLFGEAGVGKTHVAEVVLSQLASTEVPITRIGLSDDALSLSGGATIAIDPGHAAQRLSEASLGRLEAELRELGPSTVIFVDDAHQLSRPLYSWMRSLVERQVVVILAAFTAGRPVPSESIVQFSKLWRDERVKRFDLSHLTRAQTDQMIDGLAGYDIDAQARARIHRDSGGLPLFVRELALDIIDASRDIWPAGSALYPLAPLPSGSTIAVVRRRVDLLTGDQRDALMVLALLDGIPMERAMRYLGGDVVRSLLVLGHLRQVPGSTSILVSHPIEAATIRASTSDDHLADLARSLARQLRSDLPSRVRPAA